MKSRQFCSVCKEWLEMEVVPTSDGEEDDGVRKHRPFITISRQAGAGGTTVAGHLAEFLNQDVVGSDAVPWTVFDLYRRLPAASRPKKTLTSHFRSPFLRIWPARRLIAVLL